MRYIRYMSIFLILFVLNGFSMFGSNSSSSNSGSMFNLGGSSSSSDKCNKLDPKVQIISSNDDWKHINDDNKRVFCVNPGDYSSLGVIEITSSGTKDEPRYIYLNESSDDHPAKLVDDFVNKDNWDKKLAKYRIKLKNANYWVIDRLAYWEDPNPFNEVITLDNSSNNTISRALIVDTANGIGLKDGSNNNKIEKSHIEKTKWSVDYAKNSLKNGPFDSDGYVKYEYQIFADMAAIGLEGTKNSSILNNTIENNEIINFVDAIQLTRVTYGSTAKNIDFAGTKIVDNLLYVTPDIYTDCNAKFTKDGDCSVSENAIDIKAGSKDSDNPIEIKNNIMFGFKQSDSNFYSPDNKIDDAGSAIVSHYYVRNVNIEDNLIFNTNFGIDSDGPLEKKIAFRDITINNNTFYNNKYFEIILVGTQSGKYDGAKNINITKNTFANNKEVIDSPTVELYNTQKINIDNNLFVYNYGFWTPFDFKGYENVNNKKLAITNNTFYSKNVEEAKDSIPKNVEAHDNNFTDEDFDFSTIDREYKTRKFTSNPQKHNLVE